jgi:hypothetical protein
MDEKTGVKGAIEDESRPAGQEDKTQEQPAAELPSNTLLDSKTEAKLLSALGKLFEEARAEEDIIQYLKRPADKLLVMDESCILAFKPNNQDGRRLLSRFTRGLSNRVPVISAPGAGAQSAEFTAEQLALILGVFNCFKGEDKHVKITLITDKPIKLENKYFTAWLAPRIESC